MTFLSPQQLQTFFWAIIGFGFLLLVYILSPVLTPFLMAGILAYLLHPGVDWLCRHKFPRWLAVMCMMLSLVAAIVILLLVLIPVIEKEYFQLQQQLPAWTQRLNETLSPRLREWFGLRLRFDGNSLRDFLSKHWSGNNENLMAVALSSVKIGGGALLTLLGNVFLVPIVLFYLLQDWWRLLHHFEAIIPLRFHFRVVSICREVDDLLSQFLRGQMLVMLLLAAYYSIALAIAGFDIALPVGIVTGLLVFVPYLGFTLGLLLALLAAVLQFGDWYGLIAVAVIYGVGQFIESFFLTPRLVGERIGLHPLAVIFALLAFGQVFGFFGILLALPASAALLVGLKYLKNLYLSSDFYQR